MPPFDSEDVDPSMIEVRVRAGEFVGAELTALVALSTDPKVSRQRIKAACTMLLDCLPVTELRELDERYAEQARVPVVRPDGSVGTVTPEIERAITEQRKLRKLEPRNEPTKPANESPQSSGPAEGPETPLF